MSTASNHIIKAHEKGLNATITLHGAGGEFAVECPDAEVRQFIEEGIADKLRALPASLAHAHAPAMGIFQHCTSFLGFADADLVVVK